MWAGIFVWGVKSTRTPVVEGLEEPAAIQSRNITIQNSTVHDTYGDGIAIYMSHEGTIKNSVVYRSGMEPGPPDIGTPVGLVVVDSARTWCAPVRTSPTTTIGRAWTVVDTTSTTGRSNSTMQYNYGHDNGALLHRRLRLLRARRRRNIVATTSAQPTARCTHTSRRSRLAASRTRSCPGQSEIYLCTWGGGKLSRHAGSTTTPSTSTAAGRPDQRLGLFDVCPGGGRLRDERRLQKQPRRARLSRTFWATSPRRMGGPATTTSTTTRVERSPTRIPRRTASTTRTRW